MRPNIEKKEKEEESVAIGVENWPLSRNRFFKSNGTRMSIHLDGTCKRICITLSFRREPIDRIPKEELSFFPRRANRFRLKNRPFKKKKVRLFRLIEFFFQ